MHQPESASPLVNETSKSDIRCPSNCARLLTDATTETRQMVTKKVCTDTARSESRRPTAYLIHERIVQPDQLELFLLAKVGFALDDAQAMVSASTLYSSSGIISRIIGTPSQAVRQNIGASGPARLNVQQSAIAYQFAKVLEHATTVFGTIRLAEEWLDRPCRHLAGSVPLDMVDNYLGFQVVEDYLERIELGVYQ